MSETNDTPIDRAPQRATNAAPSAPVAWTWHFKNASYPSYCERREVAESVEADGITVVPLYTRPAPREGVTEAMVEAGVAALVSHTPRLVASSPDYHDPIAVALRHSFVRHILTAALAVSP